MEKKGKKQRILLCQSSHISVAVTGKHFILQKFPITLLNIKIGTPSKEWKLWQFLKSFLAPNIYCWPLATECEILGVVIGMIFQMPKFLLAQSKMRAMTKLLIKQCLLDLKKCPLFWDKNILLFMLKHPLLNEMMTIEGFSLICFRNFAGFWNPNMFIKITFCVLNMGFLSDFL